MPVGIPECQKPWTESPTPGGYERVLSPYLFWKKNDSGGRISTSSVARTPGAGLVEGSRAYFGPGSTS